jgi:FtsP/CotA-like multicopper oxidase with cupredoxin domain
VFVDRRETRGWRASLGEKNMIAGRISRRQVLGGLCSMMAEPLVGCSKPPPVQLEVTTRTIEVKGLNFGDRKAQTAQVYELAATGSRAPGLRFIKGNRFRVQLVNRLSEPTLIHWHGLTVPSAQDGVPGLSKDPIAGGATYDYDFPLVQSGTYWMHSHMNLGQTQRLMSAPLIIADPEDAARDEQEVVVLLNDFTFQDPDLILRGLQANLQAALRAASHGIGTGMTTGSMNMGSMTMGSMTMGSMNMDKGPTSAGTMNANSMYGNNTDISSSARMGSTMPMSLNDVEYDAYLANRRTLDDPEVVRVERGGRVRLRIINGADATNFTIDLGSLLGQLIAVDGRAVVPFSGVRFPIAMAQRLDIRVALPPGEGFYPILAQREGDVIRTGIVLATANARVPRIEPLADGRLPKLYLGLEQQLVASELLPPRPAQRTHEVVLGGDMWYFVWTINGKVYGEDTPLSVVKGERVELVLRNTTMMSHPIHLHGTDFQVVAIGSADPNKAGAGTVRLKGVRRDTVIVPPATSVTVAFDADTPGRWAFHCHNSYHMAAGMMTSIQYVAAGNNLAGTGLVISSIRASQMLVVNGDAIPGYMAAMTMTYRVSDPGLLDGLNPNDKIGFTIDPASNTITKLEVLGHTP